MKGILKHIVMNRYYGFIRGQNGEELFFHKDDFSGHWDDLVEDWTMSKNQIPLVFDIVDSPKGPRAGNVSRMDYPNQVEGGR